MINYENSHLPSINAISLFSGGGGLDLGFSAAGVSIVYATDIDEHSCQTLKLNDGRRDFYQGVQVAQKDVRELHACEIFEQINTNKIDLVFGGPPCQAFSVFGRRKGLEDPRGNMVWEFVRLIQEIEPTAFIFENVEGLKTIENGKLYTDLCAALSLNGMYQIHAHTYEFAEYGIPQFRKRVFLIGSKNHYSLPYLTQTHGQEGVLNEKIPYLTVGVALADMPPAGEQSGLPNHIGRQHSDRIIKRYESLSFGERDSKTRINKLHPSRPSYTIIVGSDKGGGKGHIHPFIPREVTPRESARLQTFPDWWEFYGKGRHVIRQVGNAVPPLFAGLLASHIREYLFHIDKNLNYHELVQTLELEYLKVRDDYRLFQP